MRRGSLAKLASMVGLPALFLLVAVGHAAPPGSVPAGLDREVKERIKASIDVGLAWLSFRQQENGSWGDSAALTALAVRALVESPRRYTEADGPFVRNAFEYLGAASRPDGAFGDGGREETALVLLALLHSAAPSHRQAVEKGRDFLLHSLTSAPGDRSGAGEARRDSAPGAPDTRSWRELALVRQALHGVTVPSTHPVWKVLSEMAGGKSEADLFALLGGSTSGSYFLAHAAYARGQQVLPGDDGVQRSRRTELAEQILAAQELAGSWPARSADGSEGDRLSATSFALLALERLYED